MRSPHYHCATRSAHIAISRRATYLRGRQPNRYRRLENDLKKVCGKPSARKHGGRSYNIGANNGSKRGHAQGASAASTHAGKQGRPHRGGGQKSPPLTRHQQARTRARERTGASTATRPHARARPRAHTDAGASTGRRAERARYRGTLYVDVTWYVRTIYSVK